MNVVVKHNGANISSHVIRYDREHKICSGIGMLELEVAYTYSNSFDPWDSIDIYENGNHTGGYFVSQTSEGQPSATIVVTAQDNSKRLSDYFITESYIVDYPSYSRYWIEKFLDEVGIDYTFTTTSQGNLLSNNTSLGLTTAYDQVLNLLQISGWYITFLPNGEARIGKMTNSLANVKATAGKNKTIDIKVIKHDQMLRNRVVVWGNGDPTHERWVFADVSKTTKWNYDANDKRTIVISNSNIPNVSSAFLIANLALTEFARITVEKHLTVAGALDILPGDVIAVKTQIFNGKGVVTTFGTSMSKEGLVTNIVLDERCPRLFSFFDLGGYVYVGTYGSGVWRKHITTWSGFVSSGWMPYYSGLEQDMFVTDLHVNQGVLGCVTNSGHVYYNVEDDGPWSGIPISGLYVTYSGQQLEPVPYSGLMGRACIIDRDSNYIRYAINNASGINSGDFLIDSDPLNPNTLSSFITVSGQPTSSGFNVSLSGMRSWILDVNPYDGSIMNTYSIVTSGVVLSGSVPSPNYNYRVYDIENDGSNDYVSVGTIASGSINNSALGTTFEQVQKNMVYYTSEASIGYPDDASLRTTVAYKGIPTPELQLFDKVSHFFTIFFGERFCIEDNTPTGKGYFGFWDESFGGTITPKVMEVYYVGDTLTNGGVHVSPLVAGAGGGAQTQIAVKKKDTNHFRFLYLEPGLPRTIKAIDLNIDDDTAVRSTINTVKYSGDAMVLNFGRNSITNIQNGSKFYTVYCIHSNAGGAGLTDESFEVRLETVDMMTGAKTDVFLFDPGIVYGGPIGTNNNGEATFNRPKPSMFAFADGNVYLICPYLEIIWTGRPTTHIANYRLMRVTANITSGTVGTPTLVIDWSALYGGIDKGNGDWIGPDDTVWTSPLTGETRFYNWPVNRGYSAYGYGIGNSSSNVHEFHDNYYSVYSYVGVNSHKGGLYSEVFMVRHPLNTTEGIGKLDATGEFTRFDPATMTPTTVITIPGYDIIDGYQGIDSFNGDLFFKARNATTLSREMVAINPGTHTVTRRWTPAFGTDIRELMFGKWRVKASSSAQIAYVDPGELEMHYPVYLVLQRDNYDFKVVKSGLYQDRLDISIYSPLLTMDRRISSLESYYIGQDHSVLQTTHVGISGYNLGSGGGGPISIFASGVLADDFRYSDFDLAVESGTARQAYIIYSGGAGAVDVYTLDNFSGVYANGGDDTPLGIMKRIEMSNYKLPDQYIFLAMSGYNTPEAWGFYQKDPSGVFIDYSNGYPQARTTIIRLDDKL